MVEFAMFKYVPLPVMAVLGEHTGLYLVSRETNDTVWT